MALGCRACLRADSPLLALFLQQVILSVLKTNNPNSPTGLLLVAAETDNPSMSAGGAPFVAEGSDGWTTTPGLRGSTTVLEGLLPVQVAASRRLSYDKEQEKEEDSDWVALGVVYGMMLAVGLLVFIIYLARGRSVSGEEPEALPGYWANTGSDDGNFSKVVYVGRPRHGVFGGLLAKTYEGKATQDRYCPEPECQGKRTPGGCEHVKPGAKWLPTGYEPVQVLRVENVRLFKEYTGYKEGLEEKITEVRQSDRVTPKPKTSAIVSTNASGDPKQRLFSPLAEDLSEVYLFHGTTVRKALAIAKGNFDLKRAGEASGTPMFGRGIYFAESSTKADEYARDDPGEEDYYRGVYAMLLCRVCLGSCYKARAADVEAMNKQVLRAEARYQSILGDRRRAAGTFREFVVGAAEQVYPEYIILYTRTGGGFETGAPVPSPFRTEVPIYWENFHRDPQAEPGFDSRFGLSETDTLHRRRHLQAFARATHSGIERKEAQLLVQSVKRIEVAAQWLAYMETRRRVLEAGAGVGRCPGKPVLTLAKLSRAAAPELSLWQLEGRVNELWLWHGTRKESAEQIVRHGFQEGAEVGIVHGARFGDGVYFAEDLRLALVFAPADDDGDRHLLLCRVVCGAFVPVADDTRSPSGLDCLLASPPNRCRQFVVRPSQVYPEYHLKLEAP